MSRKTDTQIDESPKPTEPPLKSEELSLDELDEVSGGSGTNHVHWSEWSKWN